MKKLIPLFFALALTCSLAACTGGGESSSNSESNSSSVVHKHQCTKVEAKESTCKEAGNSAYWACNGCDKMFNNQFAQKELTMEDVMLPKLEHEILHIGEKAATCEKAGNIEYWRCNVCISFYEDEECTAEIIDKKSVTLPALEHATLAHTDAVKPNGYNGGVVEHWYCDACENYYADATCENKITREETILGAPFDIPDFVVEVPVGKDPVVLQLTDTQIIDLAQARPTSNRYDGWATDQMEELCYNHLTEVITATKPDLILLTGDNVFGEYDDAGTTLISLVNFMETFKTPWAPIFGNHDNESTKGVDWQCDQFEKAKYCLFEQKELSGNGNYSVAIAQGGDLKRVFYMMDTHAVSNASAESLANGHTYNNYCGFKQDQIDWYTAQIAELKKVAPEVKLSFAYHIPSAMFMNPYIKYGFRMNEAKPNINIYLHPDKEEGDFGFIGMKIGSSWDGENKIFNDMKAMGVDSIYVGHWHANFVSTVYEGVRFQFGLKSSEYDNFCCMDENGNITYSYKKTGTPLVGGTVNVLSAEDGEIIDAYNYFCGFENGQVDWSQYNK